MAFLQSPRKCLGRPLGILSAEVCLPPMYLSKYIFLRMLFSISVVIVSPLMRRECLIAYLSLSLT